MQAGWAARRKKNKYLQAQFPRLKARRGPKKALIAVAASILTIVYHMLRNGTCYRDLGPEYFARRNLAKLATESATSATCRDQRGRIAALSVSRESGFPDVLPNESRPHANY